MQAYRGRCDQRTIDTKEGKERRLGVHAAEGQAHDDAKAVVGP